MRRLLVVVLVLVGLFAVVDRVAVRLADSAIERRIAQDTGAEVDAHVTGFPFLTQALRRDIEMVTVNGSAPARLAGITVRDLRAELRRVDVTDVERPVAGEVDLEGVVPFRDVERRLDLAPGSLSQAPRGQLQIRRPLDVGGQQLEVSAFARVLVEDGALVALPTTVEVAGAQVDVEAAQLGFRYPLSGLPEGARVEALGVLEDGFRVRVVAPDVALA